MSKSSGDKARFGKERKKKMLRRKHTLALRQSLANGAPAIAPGSPSEPSVLAANQPDLG